MIPLFKVGMSPTVSEDLAPVLLSGFIGQGPKVEEFEKQLNAALGFISPSLLSMNSCTAALDMSLHLAGVGPGDLVLATPISCLASNAVIHNRGATIAWLDVNPLTGNVDADDLFRCLKLYPEAKAAMLVDWAGRISVSADTATLADEHRQVKTDKPLILIEDAAHAFDAFDSEACPVGFYADYACFSGNTLISTDQGQRKIKNIKVGDKVLTESGNFEKVAIVHKNTYLGKWARIKAGQARLSGTASHPVKVFREGRDHWLPMGQLEVGDCVYVTTQPCREGCGNLVPFYGEVCSTCFEELNSSDSKREKLHVVHQGSGPLSPEVEKGKSTCRVEHHFRDVEPHMLEYSKKGFKVIPLIYCLPDFIAIKDGRVIAVEIESGPSVKWGKRNKYDRLDAYGHSYDEVRWVHRSKKKKAPRYNYEMIGALARVPVSRVENGNWGSNTKKSTVREVYNLTVENDATYFARNILVHNCWSFQAIKHLTTADGGALLCPPDQYERAKLLRWYGLDRTTGTAMRCLSPNAKIRRVGGQALTIERIVKERLPVEVFCLDAEGTPITARVTNWISSPRAGRKFLRLSVEGLDKEAVTVTQDHLIATKGRGWVKAEDLNEDELVATPYRRPSKIQLEILVGSLLGDGGLGTRAGIGRATYNEHHSMLQEEYSLLKQSAFSGLVVTSSLISASKKRPNGAIQFSLRSSPFMARLRKLFYPDGKKIIPRDYVSQHWSDLVLAIWFMDDGHSKCVNQRDGIIPQCQIATNSFCDDDIAWLADFLTKKGLPVKVRNKRLFFNKEGSLELVKRIAKYVPPSLRYKVVHLTSLNGYDQSAYGDGFSEVEYAPVKVALEERKHINRHQTVYCLEVSGIGNFSAGPLIVHNCTQVVPEIGMKYQMNDIAASIGLSNLKMAQKNVDKGRQNAAAYNAGIAHPDLTLPPYEDGCSYWLYTLLVGGGRRDEFLTYCKANGIEASLVHVRNDVQTALRTINGHELPGVDRFAAEEACIPVGFWLTDEDIAHVIKVLNAF